MKYNKAGTNLQGQVTILVRRSTAPDGTPCVSTCIYQFKANNLLNLSVKVPNATFNSKANLQVWDESAPGTLLVVPSGGGNLTLQLTMTDASPDTLGITVWDGSSTLLFSSSWNESTKKTAEQTLGGGQVRVH